MEFSVLGYVFSIKKKLKHKNRRSGYSTRLIDKYVQELFNTGYVKVIDHYPTREASRLLLSKLVDRLRAEHKIEKRDLNINLGKLEITLYDYKEN